MPTGNFIKQIKIGEINYDIDAKYWDGHEFEDLTKINVEAVWTSTQYASSSAPAAADLAKIPAGVKVKYNDGAAETTGTLAATSGDKNTIYLVYSPNIGAGVVDNYDEYMIVLEGSTYKWERLGGIGDIDLSAYAKTGDVTSAANGNTGEKEATSITNGTASVTYSKAATVTGEAGGTGSSASTGTAGAISYSPVFTGEKATLEGNVSGTAVDAHTYTPAGNITGSASINDHTHTIGTTSTTVVTGVSATASGGAHTHAVDSHEHGENVSASAITTFDGGTAASCTASTASIGPWLTGATVSNNVLSWTTNAEAVTVATGINFTPNTIASISYTAVTAAGASNAKTLTAAEAGGHTHSITPSTASITYANATVTGSAGAATINGSSFAFSGTEATLSHSVTQGSVSISYTPAGTINGLTMEAHSHTYDAPTAHTHTIALSDATASGTATGTVPAHSHTLGNHTHTI